YRHGEPASRPPICSGDLLGSRSRHWSSTGALAVVDEADLCSDVDRLMRSAKPTIDAGGPLVLRPTENRSPSAVCRLPVTPIPVASQAQIVLDRGTAALVRGVYPRKSCLTFPAHELLRALALDVADIQVAARIDGNAMHPVQLAQPCLALD